MASIDIFYWVGYKFLFDSIKSSHLTAWRFWNMLFIPPRRWEALWTLIEQRLAEDQSMLSGQGR